MNQSNAGPRREADSEPTVMSDRELIDWLSRRSYVEATDRGEEDPRRFEFHGAFNSNFRRALSRHISKYSRRSRDDQ